MKMFNRNIIQSDPSIVIFAERKRVHFLNIQRGDVNEY